MISVMISLSHWSKDKIVQLPGSGGIPLTFDFIRHWASHTPNAAAVVVNGNTITYATFHRHLCNITLELAKLELSAGQVVTLSLKTFYLNLLTLIALENLGLVSSVVNWRSAPSEQLLGFSALFLAEESPPITLDTPTYLMTSDWVREVLNRPHQDISNLLYAPSWDEGVRLTFSSGTSQEPKPIWLTHEIQGSWHQYYLDTSGYSQETRLLVYGSLAVNVFYSRATVCLRLGATVMHLVEPSKLMAIGPNKACMMPIDLETLLRQLPPDFTKPESFVVHTGGAALGASLKQRALERLCTAIHNNYGCVETGVIAQMYEEKSGSLAAGVDVEIVNEQHQKLPQGQIGKLRVKSKTLINSYWQHPEATQTSFRDGWFYPGDEALLLDDHRVQLMGRQDDLLNLGGKKSSPEPFELALKKLAWVEDAAFVAIDVSGSGRSFGIALVLSEIQVPPQWGSIILQVVHQISPWIAMNEFKPRYVLLPGLPYTETKKLKRKALRELFQNSRDSD